MTTSMVSTYSLGAAMLSSMARAQNQLTQLTAEASSGEYADLGLQLGDQSGYELSLRNQTNLLQSLTTANNLTATNLKTALAALELDPHHRRERSLDADLADRRLEQRRFDPTEHRDQRAAGADLGHQHHLQRSVRVRRRKQRRRADGGLLLVDDFGGQERDRRCVPEHVRLRADFGERLDHLRLRYAEFHQRNVRQSVQRLELDKRLVVGVEHRRDDARSRRASRRRPRPTPTSPGSSSSPKATRCSPNSAARR